MSVIERMLTVKPFSSSRTIASSALLSVCALTCVPVQAELIYGITSPGASQALVAFDSASPENAVAVGSVTGVRPGHHLWTIDFRPSNGQLYGLSSGLSTDPAFAYSVQLYTVDVASAKLSYVGGVINLTAGPWPGWGRPEMEFDPVRDQVRVVTDWSHNYRLNADSGTLLQRDSNISLALGGVIRGIAYDNNFAGATATTLYSWDYMRWGLGRIGSIGGSPYSADTGFYAFIGSGQSGSDVFEFGFDISGLTGTAFYAFPSGATNGLYTVDLRTGGTSMIGVTPFALTDIAVSVVPEPNALLLMLVGLLGLSRFAALLRKGPQ